MVNWEDGTKISNAYVDSNGNIVPAVYEGRTPLKAHNLNKMQQLIDTYIGKSITAKTIEGAGKIIRVFGNLEQDNTNGISPANPVEINVINSIVVEVSSKNILQNFNNVSIQGVSAKNNYDGSVSITGNPINASGSIYLASIKKIDIEDLQEGNYIISVNNETAISNVSIQFRKYNGTNKTTIGTYPLDVANKEVVINFKNKIDSDTIWIEMYIILSDTASTYDVKIFPQVELGEESTSYVKNEKMVITTELPTFLAKIGPYQDSLEENGIINKEIKRLVFTGNENWTKNGQYANTFYIAKPNDIVTASLNLACTITDNFVTYATNMNNFNNCVYVGASLNFKNSNYSTLEEWKAFLAEQYANGTPVELYYPLVTPEKVEFNFKNIIPQYKDKTYVNCNAEVQAEFTQNDGIATVMKSIGKLTEQINNN